MPDKAFWQSIIENKYAIPNLDDVADLTNDLFDLLADPDPELRHTIAYGILSRWIAVYRYHDANQMVKMTYWLMKRLESDIGDFNTDSVLIRSYSAATLSLIVYRDVSAHFLGRREISQVQDAAISYLLYERDLRAYDPVIGWINAIANATSLLRYLAMNEMLTKKDLLQILNTISEKIRQPVEEAYTHDEEERLARVVIPLMRKDILKQADYAIWLEQFKLWLRTHPTGDEYSATRNRTYQNIKHFLRALHTQMLFDKNLPRSATDSGVELLEVIRIFSL